MLDFHEFFAGGGMARIGLGSRWRCLFANDFDEKKARAYRANFAPSAEFVLEDVANLTASDLPGCADLAWASFPCQDLSLAGTGAGLSGEHSGTFWPFWRLICALKAEGRAPRIVALENVCGLLTSHGGHDFTAIGRALAGAGYRFGALVLDAALFLPQSRKRLFVVAVSQDGAIPDALTAAHGDARLHPPYLESAYRALPPETAREWIWWRIPLPPPHAVRLADRLEENPRDAPWASAEETLRILSLMSPVNFAKVRRAQRAGRRTVGAIYLRTRAELGKRVQRAEVRFDDFAGCLRTPGGGSSRQRILVVENDLIRMRLISAREAARLMGLPESYILPGNYNDAYRLAGDGVVVPAVGWLATHLLTPLAMAAKFAPKRIAA